MQESQEVLKLEPGSIEEKVLNITNNCMAKRSDAYDVINALIDAGIGFRYLRKEEVNGS